MTFFQLPLNNRQRKASRFIAKVYAELQKALVEEKEKRKITQQALAEQLGVNRSVVNRQFSGKGNLTLRSISDLAWVLDREISFELKPSNIMGQNQSIQSASQQQMKTESAQPIVAIVTKVPANMKLANNSSPWATANG